MLDFLFLLPCIFLLVRLILWIRDKRLARLTEEFIKNSYVIIDLNKQLFKDEQMYELLKRQCFSMNFYNKFQLEFANFASAVEFLNSSCEVLLNKEYQEISCMNEKYGVEEFKKDLEEIQYSSKIWLWKHGYGR